MASLCKIISYNLHGLNNGLSCLTEICNDANVAVIAVQEHWLTKDNLYRLNNLHKNFVGCGISAMSNRLSCEIYCGRPFGGVGFLFRKNLASRVSILANDDSGRCSVLCLTRKPCCRKETARCRKCYFLLKFANNIHYKYKTSQASKAATLQSSKHADA